MAISLLSLSPGPSWKAHRRVLPPRVEPAALTQPAAPLPAMREHAAHIPVPTLSSHLKSSQLGFSREEGAFQQLWTVEESSLPDLATVPSLFCEEHVVQASSLGSAG